MAYDFPRDMQITVFSEEDVRRVYAVLAGLDPSKESEEKCVSVSHGAPEQEPEMQVDSAGTPFDPEIHTGTKLKDGTWRLKKGAKASESETDTDEADDEFSDFMEDDAETEEREYTDSDMSKVCNQAAQKLGNPKQVKDLIAKYVRDGDVVHSRNIPAEGRAAFVKAIEEMAGIKFEG